ncbi:putative DNA-binding domain-containing protein [Nevskia ramosa]|uniref:HvfC/BufC family peptide modification chaperone n=1 Tax=Nevskia ramosa TaxID=64002 RepID=UPI003D0A8898
MSGLAQLQHDFSAYLLRDDASICSLIVGDRTAALEQRVNVYRDGYRLRLIEVLTGDFPGLLHLLGAADFDALCRDYIDAHPSTHFNIRWFGGRLPDFLSGSPRGSQRPAVVEMAVLEWTLTLAFDAVDEVSVTMADAAALTAEQWPGMKLRMAAAVLRRQFVANVGAIRRAIDREETPPAVETFDAHRQWVVWRLDRGVYQRQMDADEAAAFDGAAAGASFAEICAILCEWHAEEHVAIQAAGFLKLWIEQQWIAELIVDLITDHDAR